MRKDIFSFFRNLTFNVEVPNLWEYLFATFINSSFLRSPDMLALSLLSMPWCIVVIYW